MSNGLALLAKAPIIHPRDVIPVEDMAGKLRENVFAVVLWSPDFDLIVDWLKQYDEWRDTETMEIIPDAGDDARFEEMREHGVTMEIVPKTDFGFALLRMYGLPRAAGILFCTTDFLAANRRLADPVTEGGESKGSEA